MKKIKNVFFLTMALTAYSVSMDKFVKNQNNPEHKHNFNSSATENKENFDKEVIVSLNTKEINGKYKKYIIEINEKTKNQILKKEIYLREFEKIIKNISQYKNLNDDVLGYVITIFRGKVSATPFLGSNAK